MLLHHEDINWPINTQLNPETRPTTHSNIFTLINNNNNQTNQLSRSITSPYLSLDFPHKTVSVGKRRIIVTTFFFV